MHMHQVGGLLGTTASLGGLVNHAAGSGQDQALRIGTESREASCNSTGWLPAFLHMRPESLSAIFCSWSGVSASQPSCRQMWAVAAPHCASGKPLTCACAGWP